MKLFYHQKLLGENYTSIGFVWAEDQTEAFHLFRDSRAFFEKFGEITCDRISAIGAPEPLYAQFRGVVVRTVPNAKGE